MLEAGVVEQAADAVDVDLALTVKDQRMRDAVRVGLFAGPSLALTAPHGDQRRNGAGVRRAAGAHLERWRRAD